MDGDMARGMSRGIGVFVFSRGSPEESEEFPSLTCGPMTARSMSVGVVPCIYRREDSSEELLGHSMQFGDGAMSWGV